MSNRKSEIKLISVIIPCKNEEQYIGKCINSVINSDYPKDYLKIIVCDGMSSDSSPEIIQKYSENYQNVKFLVNKEQITSTALNSGITAFNADVYIILGAHAEIYPDYIDKCVETLYSDRETGCAGGIIENISENDISETISLAMSSGFGVGNAYFRTAKKQGFVDTVAFGAYKSEVFVKCGMFDGNLVRNQDDEFNFRIIKHGYKIYLDKRIKAKYYVRSSWKKLFRQYYQYGYWKVYVNVKHKTITSLRQIAPFLLILFSFSGAAFLLLRNPVFTFSYLIILIVYFILGISEALRLGRSAVKASRIFLTFLILHFSYGIGYAEGILQFVLLRKLPLKRNTSLSR